MTYSYTTHGTCSRRIDFDIDDDNTVHNVHFTGGCNGNLAGISSIVEGMDAEEIIDRFDGIRCGFKQTSCPDQFAEALREAPLTTHRISGALPPSFGKAITILEDSIEWSSNQ